MKIAVFGATGKTGRLVVEKALADGHEVTAFVRDPAKLAVTHPALRKVQGAADQPEKITEAVRGVDAVISGMGSGHGTLTAFAQHLVPAMNQAGASRVVSLVGAGVASLGDPRSVGRSVMLGLMRLVARHVLEDATNHAERLRRSDLDWTLVRPPRLVDGAATGKIQHAPSLKLGPSNAITRADLAAFIVDLACGQDYARQAPMVANAQT